MYLRESIITMVKADGSREKLFLPEYEPGEPEYEEQQEWRAKAAASAQRIMDMLSGKTNWC